MRRNLLLLLLWLAGLLAVDAQTLSRKEVETYVINQYGKRWKDIALYLGEKDTLDKDNALTFEKTISVRGKSKNELFVDLNYWFLKTFSNASSSIEMPGIAYHSGGYSSYCVNIRPLVRCDIKDEQVKLTIVVPNYEVTKVDDGIWSAMLDEDFDKHPPYTVNETWSLNVCFPFAKKDGTKKTSSKALVMSHGYVEVLMNRIQMAL